MDLLLQKMGILEVFGHRRPQFSSDLSDIWLEYWMCTTTLPTKLWDQNFEFLSLFFMDFQLQKKVKLEILEVFGHFLIKFFMPDPETWLTGILWVLSNVCEKLPLWAKFLALFWPRIGPKYVNMWVFFYFLENFPRNHRKLYLLAHWS